MTPAELIALAERVEAGENTPALVLAISDAADMDTPHGNPLESVNDALTLMPPNYRLGDLHERDSGDFRCALFPRAFSYQLGTKDAIWCSEASTLAAAIAAASLRARAGDRR